MFDNLKSFLGLKTKSVGFYSQKQIRDLFNQSFDEEQNITNYINEGYAVNPYVNQVINKIAKTIGRLPLNYNSPDVESLLEKPNSSMFQNDFFEALITSLFATGNAFGYTEGNFMKSVPDEVKILNTQYLDPYFDGEGDFSYAIYDNGNGRQIKILPNELIHIKFANIIETGDDQWFGTSPLRALQKTYLASNEVINAQRHLFKNKGAIGFITSNDSQLPLTPKERNEIDKQFRDNRIGGSENYGKILTTSTPVTYTEVGKSPKDLMLDTASVSFLRIICSSFGVDSALFNDPQNKTYNNRLEAQRDYYNDVCIPLMNKLLQAFNYQWGTNIEVNTDEILAIQKEDENTSSDNTELNNDDNLKDSPVAQTENEIAQANLRGSVGGVQGILSIQQSVSAGTTSVSSAIATLIEIYGFDKETAKRILG